MGVLALRDWSLELTNPASKLECLIDWKVCTMNCRAGFEGMFSKHFGSEIINELFYGLHKKTIEFFDKLKSSYMEKTKLFVVLKRK